jgi:hypothetical protein
LGRCRWRGRRRNCGRGRGWSRALPGDAGDGAQQVRQGAGQACTPGSPARRAVTQLPSLVRADAGLPRRDTGTGTARAGTTIRFGRPVWPSRCSSQAGLAPKPWPPSAQNTKPPSGPPAPVHTLALGALGVLLASSASVARTPITASIRPTCQPTTRQPAQPAGGEAGGPPRRRRLGWRHGHGPHAHDTPRRR